MPRDCMNICREDEMSSKLQLSVTAALLQACIIQPAHFEIKDIDFYN